MSDNNTNPLANVPTPFRVADVVAGLEPMGNLSQFIIDDLTPDDEDVFFGILADA